MKRAVSLCLALALAFGLGACTKKEENFGGSGGSSQKKVSVGVAIYKFDDTHMTRVRTAMEAAAKGTNVQVSVVDSQNAQTTQNDQVDSFITKGVQALAVNPVDRTAAGPIIAKAKNAGIGVVFFNREPEATDMESYDKVYYVGARAEESGTMSGEIIADYFKAHPEADKNGDGKLQYIMLTGEPGHQDATLRAQYSIQAIRDAGIEVEKLAEDTAMWNKSNATDLMAGYISNFGADRIEAVLCHNDDMALGAIEALKAAGYNTGDENRYVPVVGVDATAPAIEAMGKGELLGTVLNDGEKQGIATYKIAAALAEGKAVDEETVGYEVTDGKYVWVPYVKVTEENYRDYR